jgi:aminoglycoside phosphotransferase
MLGKKVGAGRTANVYVWEDDPSQVVKLFAADKKYFGLWEAEIHNRLAEFELPIPEMFGTVEVGDDTGVLFARVEGKHLSKLLLADGAEVEVLLQKMADIQREVCQPVLMDETLPVMKEVYRQRIIETEELTREEKRWLYEQIDALPNERHLCHGDFHTDNILVSEDGEWFVIDWLTAGVGSLEADVARTMVTMQYGLLSYGVETGREDIVAHLWNRFADYLKIFKIFEDFNEALYFAWLPVVMGARLREQNSAMEQEKLLADLREFL